MAAAARNAISAVTTEGTATSAVQPLEQLGKSTSPSAAQPLEQLGKRTSQTAARKSTILAEITTSGRRSVTLAARHVSAVRRGRAIPRRLRDNHVRTKATASYVCGIIFRSPCRAVRHWSPCHAVRHSPPSPLDITRQRWAFDLFNLRAIAATHQLRTYPVDATAAPICRVNSTFTGAYLGFRLELPPRAIPGFTGTIRASRRVSEFGLTDRRTDGGSVGESYPPSAFVGQLVGVDQVNDSQR